MIRAAGYCRVSTDREDQANSLESQQRYFREYVSRQTGWELYEIYADEGITGTSVKKRVQFNRMIRDARAGKFSLILTKEISRFSRNILDTIAYTRELRQLGVEVIFLTDGIRTMDPDAELRLSIMASIAQEESRKTSARVKWGQTRQMEKGVVFGHSLLGYTVKNGGIFMEPTGAETVRMIFRKYAEEKKGASEIAREMMEKGRKTGSGTLRWTGGYVLKILSNEKYVGDLVQKKTCTPDYLTHEKKTNDGREEMIVLRDHHEAIVSRELWEAAQDERRKRRPLSQGHSVKYPLSGKIRCGQCGRVFISRQKKRGDGTSYQRWGCSSAAFGKSENCGIGRMLRNDSIQEMLKIAAESLEMDHAAVIGEILEVMQFRGEEEIEQRKRELDSLSEKRERALEGYLNGLITGEEFEKVRSRIDMDIRETEERISRAKPKKAEEENGTLRKCLCAVLDEGAFLQHLVEEIVVYGNGRVELKLRELETRWIFTQDG